MSEAFTPGPWRIVFGSEITTSQPGIVEGSRRIARCDNSLKPDAEVTANARLIAAAPELLAALQALVERGTDSPEHIAAERAIAKATGQ